MLKLISGALIGGVNYEEIYMDSEIDDKTNPQITTNNMGVDQNTNIHIIPTLPETARKVARLEKRKLDKKQYINTINDLKVSVLLSSLSSSSACTINIAG
jgi:hypothetical protein